MKNIEKTQEYEHFKRCLKEYNYFMRQSDYWKKEHERLSDLLNECTGHVKGISFEEKSGNSHRLTTYENELIISEATAEAECRRMMNEAERIDKREKINFRLSKLSDSERWMIESRYFMGMTLHQIAKVKGYSDASTPKRKIERIIYKMVEMEI